MKFVIRFAVPGLLLLAVASLPARGQSFDQQKYEQKAKELLQQVQSPNFDPDQFRQQMRDLFQQFRDDTANMSPDQVDQIRQKMMENLQPVFQQVMPMMMRRMQEGVLNQLKTQLECTDEEFTALKPALQKVLDAQTAVAIAGRRFGRGAPPPPQNANQPSLAAAMAELHSALAEPDTKADVIKAKLDQVRAAREHAEHDLAVAQAELKPLLTIRQESILVANGMLE